MKKKYQKAELEMLNIESDIILTSETDSVDASHGGFVPGDVWGNSGGNQND